MKTVIESLLDDAVIKVNYRDISGALGVLLDIYKLDRDNPGVWNLNSVCYYRLGEFERANKCLEEAERNGDMDDLTMEIKASMSDPTFQYWVKRYKEALKLVEQKNYKLASLLLQKLLEEHDEFISVYQVLGLCYLAMGDEEQAKRVWEKGLAWDTANPALLKYLNLTENTVKQVEDFHKPVVARAEEIFNVLNRKFVLPTIVVLLVIGSGFLLQAAFSSEQKYSHKSKINTSAISTNQEMVAVASPYIMNETHDDIDITINEKQSKVEQEKQYYDKGFNAYLASNLTEAIDNLTIVADMNSGSYINREAVYYLARCYFLQHNYFEATKYFQQCLSLFPESNYHDDCLFFLACCYHFNDNNESARNMLAELKSYEPDSGYITSPIVSQILTAE